MVIRTEGEINALKDTVHLIMDELSAFASEVTRVVLQVGTEGNLGVQGTWRI